MGSSAATVRDGDDEGQGPLEPVAAPKHRRRLPHRPSWRVFLAATLGGVAAALVVRTQDQHGFLSHYFTSVMAGAALLSWLVVLPTSTWIGNRLASTSARRRSVPWITAAALVAWTVVIVLPRAPDGSDHAEHLADGKASLSRQVHDVFEAVFPGRWTMEWLDHGWTVGTCRDGFGRDRGAQRAELRITMHPDLDTTALPRFVDALNARGWTVSETHQTDSNGRSETRILADNDGYGIGVLPWEASTDPGANTPCLQP